MSATAAVNRLSPYPSYFMTPEGRALRISKMAAALRAIRRNPDADYPGWNWFPTPGHFIVRSFRDGLDHRINMRAEIAREAAVAGAPGAPVFMLHKARS